MVCEMEIDNIEEMEMEEPLPSMWPEDIDSDKQFNIEKPGQDQEMLEEVMTIKEKPKSKSDFDLKTLSKLINFTDTGSNQLANLAKHWEYKQANAVRLLKEELDILNKQKEAVELKKLEILEEHRFESESYGGDKRPISILDEVHQLWDPDVPAVKKLLGAVVESKRVETEAEFDTLVYWKQRALHSDKLLEASVVREQILVEKLQECIKSIERQEKPVDELSEILKRADNFLHFVLQNAPVVIGHQDKELRYRFIYNHFPTLGEQDIIGKTDVEIFNGAGVKESQDFKREVLEKGKPAKREITFETELFGLKTFLIYVEPVFNKAGETIGINYMGMEVSDQVIKREKMAKLREEIAVQKAKETELNKTIHITEETMRAKQMLATMSHEIRSPLSGVVSMAEILTTTKLDREQRQLLEVMLSSGDLVLQLINDILDLSKVESGVMKLEATKFRPRQVVKHVLQTAAASLQKSLTLEGYVTEDVPVEVIGDVLRIRQILTNLISNAVKFTHEGKVGIKLRMVEGPTSAEGETCLKKSNGVQQNGCDQEGFCSNEPYQNGLIHDELSTPALMNGDKEEETQSSETKTVWLRCDVYDTGIGIPENALSTLFRRYMQVSADHARKYGGTGLGLAICKQLVELMGGQLTVSSKEHCGSTFTFVLPYTLSVSSENSDPDELTDMADYEDSVTEDEVAESYFQFHPRALNSLFSSNGTSRTPKLLPQKLNGLSQISYSFPQYSLRPEEMASGENGYPAVDDVAETLSKPESSVSQIPNAKYESPPRSRSENSRSDSNHPEERRVNGFLAKTGESQETCKRQVTFADADADADSECSSGSSSKIPKSTLKPKILLVEDSKINIMVAQSMMKQLGQTIEVVNNGAEAVRAVQCCSYDLILMDVQMPIMDGLQATRIIRAFEETGNWNTTSEAGIEQPEPSSLQNGHKPFAKRIPIIAMTANAFSESAEECFANGMDSFVPKPVTRQKLKEKLEQYLPDFNLG